MANAAITDGVFGPSQIFDVQYYWDGDTLNASSFIAPYDSTFTTVTFDQGQYMAFFETTPEVITENSLDPSKTWYGVGLYDADGQLVRVIHSYGEITALGNNAVFYLGSGFFGNVITPTQGYSYGDSASFTNMNQDVTEDLLASYSSFGTTVLNPGEVFDPTDGGDGGGESVTQQVQGTLERVLAAAANVGAGPLAGTFVNIAENVGVVNPETGEILNRIDGSVVNSLAGVSSATAQVMSEVQATSQVTVNLGDISTTVLGAVNTGSITVGVNQDLTEAVAGTSAALAASIGQVGGSSDQSALIANMASNMTSIVGSVSNTFEGLNGSVGNVSTTVLGAVNTGTITSDVNSTITGIVGMSGQSSGS